MLSCAHRVTQLLTPTAGIYILFLQPLPLVGKPGCPRPCESSLLARVSQNKQEGGSNAEDGAPPLAMHCLQLSACVVSLWI